MFQTTALEILAEISASLKAAPQEQVERLLQAIIKAKMIVTCGAGRMGMMARAFAMRLGHLGLSAYHIQDCNTPRIGPGDLLIVSSGSGETKTILSLVDTAKKHQATVALLTTRSLSSMAALADIIVLLNAPSKLESGIRSIQPMTTLTEQASLVFFDTLVVLLMRKMDQSHEMLQARHSILE